MYIVIFFKIIPCSATVNISGKTKGCYIHANLNQQHPTGCSVLTPASLHKQQPQVKQLSRQHLCVTSTRAQRSSDSGMSAFSTETLGRGTGPPVDTHPRAALLKEGRITGVSPWSSGSSGRISTWRVLTGGGLGALLKPPKGVATLEMTKPRC